MTSIFPQMVSSMTGIKLRIYVTLLTDHLVYIDVTKKRRNVTFSNVYIHGASELFVCEVIYVYRQISHMEKCKIVFLSKLLLPFRY